MKIPFFFVVIALTHSVTTGFPQSPLMQGQVMATGSSGSLSGVVSASRKEIQEPPVLLRGPYLQVATPTGIHIRWRTDQPTQSRVRYGSTAGALNSVQDDPASVTEHEVILQGLLPHTRYWYSIGSFEATLQGDADNYFVTLPLPGAKRLLKIGVVGDCGNNSANQIMVRDQLQNYLGSGYMDSWILLGDNAYYYGTDAEYQAEFFNIYKDRFLKQNPLYPAPGNHDYGYDDPVLQNTHAMPYYSVFSMPVSGEAGGYASGNPAYYSFDVGNVHFLSLDSYGKEDNATRLYDTLGKQVQWIKNDLEANQNKDWIIAYWHHPPYTMGSHNSDTEGELAGIRTNFITILERYGVDLVLCGHSHVYERSRLQKGHFGAEATFDPAVHTLSSSSGLYDGTDNSCPYTKNAATGNRGTVYVVSGSAGQLGGTQSEYPHNAMYYSNTETGGAMMLEIQDNRLDARWICADGAARDRFTMMKEAGIRKAYTITRGSSLSLTASFVGSYSWQPGGEMSRTVSITPPAAGTYVYTVKDPYSCVSDTFTVTVAAPDILPATTGTLKGLYNPREKIIRLSWELLQGPDADHFEIERSTDGTSFSAIGSTATSGNAGQAYSFADNQLDRGVSVYYYRIRQIDRSGRSVSSTAIAVSISGQAAAGFDVQLVPNQGMGNEIKIRLLNGGSMEAHISLTDATGKTVLSKQMVLSATLQHFMPPVKPGIYSLTVTTTKGMITRRLVVR